jgi:hypothetical protein
MAYPTILTQEQIAPHIENTWLNINAGILYLRNLGLTGLWMPDQIKFDCIVVDQVQEIPILTTSAGIDAQTGTDTSVTSGLTTDTTNQTTSHGETVNTTDLGETLYLSGDLQTGLQVSGDPYLDPPISLPF